MDRNPFSNTFGCLHRDFWLEKVSDFPDSIRQFGTQALAIIYKNELKDNPYYLNSKILEYTIASIKFLSLIQHNDGSFDEFYPNERGWVGPTAFVLFNLCESFKLIKEDMHVKDRKIAENIIFKAAKYVARGEIEKDDLANHHAMACLAVWKSHKVLEIDSLKRDFEERLKIFKRYHDYREGWSLEYDGIDPGYLSATVSFLGKIFKDEPREDLFEILEKSVQTCSYFVYPNGFYGGTIGSRNTLHFYSHGFEILAPNLPLARCIADKMLAALSNGRVVPPAIMSDRYFAYRICEYLESFIDYAPNKSSEIVKLPCEDSGQIKYFENAQIYSRTTDNHYFLVNLAKGGVIKIFDKKSGALVTNNCGSILETKNKKQLTSQIIHKDTKVEINSNVIVVSGNLKFVPSTKLFSPLKNIIFRIVLLSICWNGNLAQRFKAWIRSILILGNKVSHSYFCREISFEKKQELKINDTIKYKEKSPLNRIMFGGEFAVRYVPQSRYFQNQELRDFNEKFEGEEIKRIMNEGEIKHMSKISLL